MKIRKKEIKVSQLNGRAFILLTQFVRLAAREGANLRMQQADIVRKVFQYASKTDNSDLISLVARLKRSIKKEDGSTELSSLENSSSVTGSRASALIVDDSEVVRKALVMVLVKRNIDVTTARDGVEALNIIGEKRHFDMVFLDVVMPGIDGYKVCKTLKKPAYMSDSKVVMLTSKSSKFDRVRASLAGSDYYLTKPVSQAEILEFVDDILRKKDAEKASKMMKRNLLSKSAVTPYGANVKNY